MAKPPNRNYKTAAKPALSADDVAQFDTAMRDVQELTGKKANKTAPVSKPPVKSKPPSLRARRQVTPPVKAAPALPSLSPGNSADVDSRTLDRLRRGRLRPEARLDLHGLTQEKAHRSLNRFIDRAQSSGVRSLIIITGKGRISEGGGVLRNQLPKWLNAPDIRPRILAFAPAQPRDGGSGALYVLLRKLR